MALTIDDAVRRMATRAAHGFQRWFGPSAFYLVWLSLMAALVQQIIDIANLWAQLPILVKPSPVRAGLSGFLLLVLLPSAFAYRIAEEKFQATGRLPVEAMYLVSADFPVARTFRLIFLGLLVLDPLFWVLVPRIAFPSMVGALLDWSLPMVAVTYFGTVVPLPPGPSKLSAWKRAWQASRLVPATAGAR